MTDIVERLRYAANAGVPDFTNSILLDQGADEIERLNAEVELWKSRTEQGAAIIEGNVAEIERLKAALENACNDNDSLFGKLQWAGAQIERLTAENDRLQTGWKLATKAVDTNETLKAEIKRLQAIPKCDPANC